MSEADSRVLISDGQLDYQVVLNGKSDCAFSDLHASYRLPNEAILALGIYNVLNEINSMTQRWNTQLNAIKKAIFMTFFAVGFLCSNAVRGQEEAQNLGMGRYAVIVTGIDNT